MMIRHMDTYWCVLGAMPFTWSWWGDVVEHKMPDDILSDNPREWVGWSLTVDELNDDETVVATWELDHAAVMRGLQAIVSDAYSYRPVLVDNARLLLAGDVDAVDFDADTADVVLQVALFGEIKYG